MPKLSIGYSIALIVLAVWFGFSGVLYYGIAEEGEPEARAVLLALAGGFLTLSLVCAIAAILRFTGNLSAPQVTAIATIASAFGVIGVPFLVWWLLSVKRRDEAWLEAQLDELD